MHGASVCIIYVAICTIMHVYSYGMPMHTRMGPIRIRDIPYAYGPIYAYGAEQMHVILVTPLYKKVNILQGALIISNRWIRVWFTRL